MKKIIQEFKEFVSRGNVLDMAVGVIIGGAFGKITTSLVNDVFMPVIGCLLGGTDLSKLNIQLKPAVVENGEVIKEAVTMGIGTFISTVIDFFLVALCVFLVVKFFNKARELAEKRKKAAEAAAEEEAPAEPEPTKEELLLAEIRDLLKNQK